MNRDELLIWKAVAIGAVLFYLYKVSKANGGTLAGNNMGIQVNPEKIVNLASHFVPEQYRSQVKNVGYQMVNKFMGNT